MDRRSGAERHLHQPDGTKRGLSLSRGESTPDVRLAHCFHQAAQRCDCIAETPSAAVAQRQHRHDLSPRPRSPHGREKRGARRQRTRGPRHMEFFHQDQQRIAKQLFFAGQMPKTRGSPCAAPVAFCAGKGEASSKLWRFWFAAGSATARIGSFDLLPRLAKPDFVRAVDFLISDGVRAMNRAREYMLPGSTEEPGDHTSALSCFIGDNPVAYLLLHG